MKVVIHHLPTGCTWNIDMGKMEGMRNHVSQSIKGRADEGEAVLLLAENGNVLIFPPKVISESVVRIEE